MAEIILDNQVERLSWKDINSGLTTLPIDPETGLTEDKKQGKPLSWKDVSAGEASSISFPGSVAPYEKLLGKGSYNPELDPMYSQGLLHERQTATSMIGNSIVRFGIEVGSTALQTIAYSSDLTLGVDLAENSQQEFGNGLSRFAELLQERGRERFPIYVDPYKQGKFDPGSVSWWAENAISVGSTIGMVAPAMLLAAATGGAASAIGLGAIAKTAAFRGITTALWSRHAENLMEASGVYKEAYANAKQRGLSDVDARDVAALGASNTYKKQWILLLQDIPQYILLNKLGAFAKGGVAAEKAAMAELAPSVQKYLGYGSLTTRAKRVGAVAKDMIGETGEEIYQFLVNEQSNLMARNAADPNHNVKHSMMDVLKANYDDGEMWTAGFWGGIGAGVMQVSMKGLNYNIQQAVNKAQLETVTSFGPMLKQAFSEYDAALADNDPLIAERAAPAFVVSLAMKAKKTNTVAALKDMMKQMREAPEGTSFEQYGVDPETQGRLKQDPAFYEQVERGIDRVSDLYDRYLKENATNKEIPEKDKEPKAQVMANTKFLLDSTVENAKKLKTAVESAGQNIEGIGDLSIPGGKAELYKQDRLSLQRTVATLKKRQEETAETASPREKKEIIATLAKIEFELAGLDNLIDEQIGNKKTKVKGIRTAEEAKADKKIVLPQDQVDEYYKQSQRLNWANASVIQLTEMMDELRTSTPLSVTREKELLREAGLLKPDTIDKDSSIQLDDSIVYEDEDTKEPINGKIVGIQEADETNENDITSFVIENERGETVVKQEGTFEKVADSLSNTEDDVYDSLSEKDEALLGKKVEVEEEDDVIDDTKGPLTNMNKLSYSTWDYVAKQHNNRNPGLVKAINNKNTSFKGSTATYRINLNDPYTKKVIESLISTGLYHETKTESDNYVRTILKIVVTDKQRGILKKFKSGNKLTKAEIVTLLDEATDESYTSFVDGISVDIELNINSTPYKGGLSLHASKFVPDSSVPVKIKNTGATQDERKKSIVDYKKRQYKKNRELRRDLLSIILQGGEVHTSGLDRSKGSPNSASKAINPSERNQNLEIALGLKAEDIKLAITKSNDLTPELTTLYLDKNSPITETTKSMQGKGSIYAYLANEGLNDETGIIKLNKGTFEPELAGLILDAFFLVGQAKIMKRRVGTVPLQAQWVKFSDAVKERNGVTITGITAGELLDLFVVHGEKITEPRNLRFQKRYGTDPILAKVMVDKRLYLHVKGQRVVLAYGNNEKNVPYTIDLNERGVPGEVSDLSRNREHFINWLIENKRFATQLFNPTLGKGALNLNGDFLDDRKITISFKTKDVNGKTITKNYNRAKGQTYASFLIKNNMVVTDVSRNEQGSLFRDPVVNLNLVKNGRLNITSKVKPLVRPEIQPVAEDVVTNEDLKNKEDAKFSDTKQEKEEKKPTVVTKDTPYKNRFLEKKNRELLSIETSEVVEDENVIRTVSKGIENFVRDNDSIDEIIEFVNYTLTSFGVEFGKGSKKNQAIFDYIEDRLAGKTNRTLEEEFKAATTPNIDKNSSTSTEATGAPVETTVNATKIETYEKVTQDYLDKILKRFTGVGDILVYQAENSTESVEVVIKSIHPQTKEVEVFHKESDQYFYLVKGDTVGWTGRKVSEQKEAAPPSMEDLAKLANNNESDEPPFARPEVATPYEGYSKEVRQKEIKWAFDVVGIAEEEWKLKNRITDLIYKGKKNFALYSYSAILLYEAAETGTVYHEAFHRVSLGYLTPDERKRFYRAARLAYKLDKESTDRQVEEILAEKFRSFILSDNKQQAPGLVQKFFDWIVQGIKSLFYGERRLSEAEVSQLFKQIRNGKYRNSSILEINKESLGNELYARAVIKGVEFNTLNNRKDFRTITNALAKTVLIKSEVEDLNDVGKIDLMLLIPHLEELRDGYKANAEYAKNTKDDRDNARHLYEMYDEILGTKDEQGRYDIFQQVIKPAIDSYFLSIGIKQVGVSEDAFTDIDTEDNESIARLGDHYIGVAYEVNKKDTALPAIKWMIATLSEDSVLIEDKDSGALRRVSKVNPITMLHEPVNFKAVWSKAFHTLHHLNSIEEMIVELKFIAERDSYAPFAELADKLEGESENVRQQFFGTLSCAEHDFINLTFRRSSRGFIFYLNRSAEQSAINDNIRQWSNNFFNDPNIVMTVEEYDAKKDKTGRLLKDKEGNYIADTKSQKVYSKKYNKGFFEAIEKRYIELTQDMSDVMKNKSKNYEGKLVKFLPRIEELLSDFGIYVDGSTIRRVINSIKGETINNDMDRLYNWTENELATLISSKASESAANNDKVDRAEDSLFKIGAVKDIARAYIEIHPEKKADMQVGPGNGDTTRKHKYNTFADDCHATKVVNWIKNKEGYVEERVNNLWTKRSRILRMMTPNDLTNEQEVAAAAEMRKNFKLVTYSYLKEVGREDKGRGYLNMTEREDYLVRFHLMMSEGLLPFPIMAQRKTYFFMDGVPRFKNVITEYDPKTKSLGFSKEVVDYFWDAYRDENERVAVAVSLIEDFKKATGEEKDNLRKQLILNYHYTGQDNTNAANAVNLIKFRGFDIIDKFDDKNKVIFTKKLTVVLNKRINNELKYANTLGVIALDTETNGYVPGLINPSSTATYESDRGEDIDYGVRATLGEYLINYTMSIIESERIFMGDPALFAKDTNSGEIVEALYKRYYGLGSTGTPYAENIKGDTEVSYNAATVRTQEFESLYYKSLLDLHTKLWKEYYDEKDKDNPDNFKKAEDLSLNNVSGFKRVDATDGSAVISPSMYKSMLKRSGAFPKKVQHAFELLMSTKVLSPAEEIKALYVVLNPQKTVYFGQHNENGIDRTVYDKMAMSVLFPRLVKGTHLEEVLHRMEKTGQYSDDVSDPETQIENKKLNKIHVLNYDTAIKVGMTTSHNLYKNKEIRGELANLRDINVELRYWRNLRQQQTTDAHEVASKQMVGSQVFKIGSSNIITDKPYGNFASGRDLLNALTKSRMAVSNIGRDHVESALGIHNGIVNNHSLISMLRKDATKARKSDDFRSALRLDSDGKMYLELDAFPDRTWMYSRLMRLVTSNTIDLKLPGSQLIQVSDYGYSSTGLAGLEKDFKSELKFYEVNSEGTGIINMECRVPIRAFKRLIPNYEKLTHEERIKTLPLEMQIMGYRIPTQGQNSVVNLTVVDYLPDQAGEVIHLPLEFTTLTGSDFDIDKLFTMMKNYIMRNGKLEEVKFLEGDAVEIVKERYENKLRELYKTYRRDRTIFDAKTSEILKDSEEGAYNETKILSDQDEIIRRNIIESLEANKKALEAATDDISKQYLEDIVSTEQRELDELNDNNFIESFNDEKWAKQRPVILKLLIGANKIGTVEDFSKLSIEAQNTSGANENRIFEIFQTVISDIKHARNTTLPLGTLTGEMKARRRKYITARSGGKTIPLEALESETPAYQSATKFKFMTSVKGIGVYALQNANHSLTQQANIKLRTNFNYGKDINEKGVIPLDLIEGGDLKYVTDWLSAMLDGHVDAIKDDYMSELNVNSATYSVTSLLLRLGFGVSTFDFLAQPIIVKLAREFYNVGGGRHVISEETEYQPGTAIDKAYKRAKRQILASLNRPVETDEDLDINLGEEDLYIPFDELMSDESLLMDGLNPNKNTSQEHKIRQLNFLEYFMRIFRDGEKVNSLVLNTRVDTKDFGSNPVEFRHFINNLIKIEQLDLPENRRDFINLDRFINSKGEYVENGTMLSTLLDNSIFYLERIFNNKSIIGSTGFGRMFWGLANSIPNSENFRMSIINSMTGDLFSAVTSKFFSDPRFGIGMTRARLSTLYLNNDESVFATISKVKSPRFKYYEELKDNKVIEMLQVDSKPLTAVENYITTPFMSASDVWENDDYIADFKAIIEHEDPTVQLLGRQLYLYAFYSTGFKHRYYDYLRYIPTSANKEINMMNTKTKKYEPASFNKFIRQMLEELNDPASIVEFYTSIKKDFFENNWYNWRYVPKVDGLMTYQPNRDENGFINYIALNFGRGSQYALGTNEDGDVVYPSYVTLTGDGSISQYNVPRTGEEVADVSDMEKAFKQQARTEESEIIGGNVALFKMVGISKITNPETKKPEDLALYVPINKKGALSNGIVTTEMGIESETSFIKYNNLIIQKSLAERIKVVKDNVDKFKEIPFEKQQVTTKMVRSVAEEIDVDYADGALDLQFNEDNRVVRSVKRLAAKGFQGYVGGFENMGKGIPEGDGKDKAMRKVADSAIGEMSGGKRQTSTSTTMQHFMDEKWNYYPVKQDAVTSMSNDVKIVMLARNGELKNKSLTEQTKLYINRARENGAEFVVGDMPGVDSQFIDYLQKIGAKFTIYHTGNESRIKLKEVNVIGTSVKGQFVQTEIDFEKGKEIEEKC